MKTEIVNQSSSYINGQWSASDEKITLKNPANLSTNIKEIYFASLQNAKKSILSADVAFANWKLTSIDYRIGLLKDLMSSLEKNKKSFSHLITLENGKTIKESMVITTGDNYIGTAENELREDLLDLYSKLASSYDKPSQNDLANLSIVQDEYNSLKSEYDKILKRVDQSQMELLTFDEFLKN